MSQQPNPIPSAAARELSAKLRAWSRSSPSDISVDWLRQDQNDEFLPRTERAILRFGSTTAWEYIAGYECVVLTPRKQTSDASILYFFGGGYVSGGPMCDLAIAASLADKTGAQITMPKYPLAPENPYPAALECAEAVYKALRNSDPTRPIIIAGESAGGGLALSLTQRLIQSQIKMPKGLCLFSPWVNLEANTIGQSLQIDDPSMSSDMVAWFANIYAPTSELKSNPELSPTLGQFPPNYPPTLITTGTQDAFFPDLIELAQKMRTNGCDIDLQIWSGLWHVFEIYDELPEAERSLDEVARFVNQHLS